MFLRPHDVDVVDNARGAIVGEVSVLRRHAGLRRVDLEVGAERNRIEIELPDAQPHVLSGAAVDPEHLTLGPTSRQAEVGLLPAGRRIANEYRGASQIDYVHRLPIAQRQIDMA